MSYIDTIAHKRLGDLAGYPLYQPLEARLASDESGGEFSCGPMTLVMGGGSGEHPGLVFHAPDSLVLHALLAQLEARPGLLSNQETVLEELEVTVSEPARASLSFCAWSVENFVNLDRQVRSLLLANPFGAVPDIDSVEEWLALNIGELVWRQLPEMATMTLALLEEVSPGAREVLLAQPAFLGNVQAHRAD